MSANNDLTTAEHYIAVGRYDQAATRLRSALSQQPDNPAIHLFLALCAHRLDDQKQALEHIRMTLQHAPDAAAAHRLHGHILAALQRFDEAQQAAGEALRLEPDDAHTHALLAHLHLHRERWGDALVEANAGLAIDPEDTDCLNLRAAALTKLRRHEEAEQTIGRTLHKSPENPQAHANMGWQLLHRNQPKQAMQHFQEALRLQPDNDFAKAGLVEAIKARNPIYRVLLAYLLWMSTLSPAMRFGVLIGGYVLYRLAIEGLKTAPQYALLLWPVIVIYLLFALLTWVGVPAFNLLLLIHPYGRYALSRHQRIAAGVFGGLFAVTLGVFGAAAALWSALLFIIGMMTAGLTLITTSAFQHLGTSRFKMRAAVAGALALLLLTFIALAAAGEDAAAVKTSQFYTYGFIGAMWFGVLSGVRRAR